MRSMWGRTLLRASAVATALAPWVADWNHGHTFGPGYGPHARWHGTAEVVASTGEGLLMLWLLADRSERRDVRVPVATLLPLLRYGAFDITLAVPGTSPYEEGRPPLRFLGLPAALVAQHAIAGLALAGWWLKHRARRRQPSVCATSRPALVRTARCGRPHRVARTPSGSGPPGGTGAAFTRWARISEEGAQSDHA
jgi:hypothetical protein